MVSSEGELWLLRAGAPWHDLPERYPPYQTYHRRFQNWVRDDTLEGILKALAQDLKEHGGLDLSESFIDGTFIVAKKRAAGGKDQAGQRYEAQGSSRVLRSSARR